jgi:ATP-dependent Lhr-like helicase
VPADVPSVFLEPTDRPVELLAARFARRHGPFLTEDLAAAMGLPMEAARQALESLERQGKVLHGEFRPLGNEREWCDPDVLRRIRRRSLAALRREVEPVDPAAFARFLPAWQGADRPQAGADALSQAVARLQGAPIPASILEADVLPARVRAFRPADLDALVSSGELVWIGAGALGASDGRVALVFRDRIGALAPGAPGSDDPEHPDGPVHEAIRTWLHEHGASFWPDLLVAAGTGDAAVVLRALWDLVWAGEVTNDTLAPLRAFLSGTGLRRPRAGPRPRPRPGALRVAGPPAGAGRWSLVPRPQGAKGIVAVTENAHSLAAQLLDRHGVVTREGLLAEGRPGGFAGVYPVLKAMEEAGVARRGYFVAGLGAAQFALPGAVDRLRGLRGSGPEPSVLTLAAADPAQPYGAALPWPETSGRPARTAGAFVVMVDGAPAAFLERGARTLSTFPGADGTLVAEAIAALVKDGRIRRAEIRAIDQVSAEEHPMAEALKGAGFTTGYRGLTYRG